MSSDLQHYVEVEGVQLPSPLLDGYQVHRAALARGLAVLALPRQVMLAGEEASLPAQVSFTHGVPQSSGLSAVTFAQDQRLRRALLERARVPKPKGATFSWRSIGKAQRWASNNGYPVVVKEGVGENPPRAIRNVASSEELREAFDELRRREVADRSPGSNPHIAGYATTRLTFGYDEEGNEVAPLRSRFLVEEDVIGRCLRVFVIGGAVVAAVELDADYAFGVRDVTDELTAEAAEICGRAVQSIPGLACATVDATTVPGGGDAASDLVVTSISERPRTETYATASSGLDAQIGNAILEHELKLSGLSLFPTVKTIESNLEIEGLRHSTEVSQELPSLASDYGVRMDISQVDSVEGSIRAWASGPPGTIAALVELLMAGYLVEDRAAAVNYSRELQNG
jgi:hypothetical protein